MGISVCFTLIFTLMFTFNNCTPIHEAGGSVELLSLGKCDVNLENFYKSNIKPFQNIGASFYCGECHTNGGDDGPQFLDNFSQFAYMSKDKGSLIDKVKESTRKVLRNATDGYDSDAWSHEGGDIFSSDPVSTDSVQAALLKAENAFNDCEAASSETTSEDLEPL